MATIDEIFAAHGFGGPATAGKTTGDARYAALLADKSGRQGPKQTAFAKGDIRNTLSAMISELGGAGGASAGAAAGAALGAPIGGVGAIPGGILGAIIGGFAGGTAGKGVENKIRDNQDFAGKGGSAKAAFTEGGIDAALSGVGQGFSAAKAAKGAGMSLSEAIGSGYSIPDLQMVAKNGTQIAQGASQLGKGTRAYADSMGLSPGKSVTNEQSAKYTKYLQDVSGANSPRKALVDLETHTSGLGQQIGDTIASNNRPLTSAERKLLKTNAQEVVSKVAGLDTSSPTITRYLKGIGQAKDLNALQSLQESLGGQARFTPGTSVDPKLNQALKGLQNISSSFLNDNVEGLSSLRGNYSTAKGIRPLLAAAVETPNGFKSPIGLSKFGVPEIGGNTAATLKAASGRALGGTGRAIGAAGGVVGKVLASPAGAQLPADLIRGYSNRPQSGGGEPAVAQSGPANFNDFGGADAAPQQPSPYPLENALQDIQRDPKNASTYLSVYKAANAASAKPSQSDSANQDNILTALSALDSSEANLVTAGGAKGAFGATADIPVLGQYLNNSGSAFNKTRIETATQLAKALTGSTRPAAQVINQYLHSLPTVTDTPAHAAAKLRILRTDILKRAQSTGVDVSAYTGQSLGKSQPSSALEQVISGLGGR